MDKSTRIKNDKNTQHIRNITQPRHYSCDGRPTWGLPKQVALAISRLAVGIQEDLTLVIFLQPGTARAIR